MPYIDFFHTPDIIKTDNDIQLRITQGNRLINIGTAKLTMNRGTVPRNTDSKLSNSVGSINISTGHVIFTFKSPIGNTEDFTLSLWVKPYSWGSSGASHVAQFFNTLNAYINDDASNKASIYLGKSPYNRYITHQNSAVLNQWNHYALVQNGNNLNLYLNGVKSSTTYTGHPFAGSPGIQIFGTGSGTPIDSLGLNGLIEDYFFTRKALWNSNFTPPTTYLPNEP